ncbi:NAD(P)H nitroreductase [Gallaecimonas sp. GXIMD4217]|uniref:NAD(P)H nitroreductase n=1 Tax=Gallaecimonas sp. GXIMD4217 TaxID=3131927 RepID=UPI00311AE277
MDALDFLLNRTSDAALTGPAPSAEALENCLQAAFRVPDHAGLRPYRFVLIDSDQARDKLGGLCQQALLADNPDADQAALDKAGRLFYRAPLVVAVLSRYQPHPKVPLIEQHISAGLAAHAMQMAALAQGYGGMWRTGSYAYHPLVREAFGVEGDDQIVGFLYLGTPVKRKLKVPRPNSADFVSRFQ